jgi:hypothetical protein
MKKLIILLAFIPTLCIAQSGLQKSSSIKKKEYIYNNVNLYKDVKNIQQLVFNIAASFQTFANDTAKLVYKPIVIINQVPHVDNTYKDISFDEITLFQIMKNPSCYWPGTKASKIMIIIETKQ